MCEIKGYCPNCKSSVILTIGVNVSVETRKLLLNDTEPYISGGVPFECPMCEVSNMVISSTEPSSAAK